MSFYPSRLGNILALMCLSCAVVAQLPDYGIRGAYRDSSTFIVPRPDSLVLMGQDRNPASPTYGLGKWHGFSFYMSEDSLCFRIGGDTVCVPEVGKDTRLIPYTVTDSICFYLYDVIRDDTISHTCFYLPEGGGGGPDPLSDSCYFSQALSFSVEQFDIDVVTGQELHFNVPANLHGWVVDTVLGFHTTAGTTGESLISVYNVTQAEDVVAQFDIDAGNLVQTQTGNYALTADDIIRIRVDGQCTTPAKGLRVVLIVRGLVPCIAYPVTTYQDGDSLCIVVNADTTCYLISGGSDTHWYSTNLLGTGNRTHDQEGYNIRVNDANSWIINNAPSSLTNYFQLNDDGFYAYRQVSSGVFADLGVTEVGGDPRVYYTASNGVDEAQFFAEPGIFTAFAVGSAGSGSFSINSTTGTSRWINSDLISIESASSEYRFGNGSVYKPPFDNDLDTMLVMDEDGYLYRALRGDGTGDSTIVRLPDYEALVNYCGIANVAFVEDSLFGGWFLGDLLAASPDSALIVDGCGEKMWHRVIEDNKYWLTWYVQNDTSWSDEMQRAIDTISARHVRYGDGTLYIPHIDSVTYWLDTTGVDPYHSGLSEPRYFCVELKDNVSIVMDANARLVLIDSLVSYPDTNARVNIFIGNAVSNVNIEGGEINGNAEGQFREAPGYYGQTVYGNIIEVYDTLIQENPDTLAVLGYRNQIDLKNIRLENHSGNSVNIRYGQDCNVEGIRQREVGEGVQFISGNRIKLSNFYATDTLTTVSGLVGDVIEFVTCTDVLVDGVVIENARDGGSGIDCFGSDRVMIFNVSMNNVGSGISFASTGGGDDSYESHMTNILIKNSQGIAIQPARGSLFMDNITVIDAPYGILKNDAGVFDICHLRNAFMDTVGYGIYMIDSTHINLENVVMGYVYQSPIKYTRNGDDERPTVFWRGGRVNNSAGAFVEIDQDGDAAWYPHGTFIDVETSEPLFDFSNGGTTGNFEWIREESDIWETNKKLRFLDLPTAGFTGFVVSQTYGDIVRATLAGSIDTLLNAGIRDTIIAYAGGDADFYEAGNTPPNSINDPIYHGTGPVHLNDATMAGTGKLNVSGALDMYYPTIATRNTFIGYQAGNNPSMTGSQNVGIGSNSLDALTSGADNVAIGTLSGTAITTGSGNFALGQQALQSNQTGSNNVAIGYFALQANTASGNVGIGETALYTNTSGTQNVGIGQEAISTNSTGSGNVGIGYRALRLATGTWGTGIGTNAGDKVSTGQGNIMIGYAAGDEVTTGEFNVIAGTQAAAGGAGGAAYNTVIGYQAGHTLTGNGNVFLGVLAGYSETGSNKLYIENSNSSDPLIEGDFAADSIRINGKLKYTTDGGAGVSFVGKDAGGFLTTISEVDGSTTNELQTLASTSDATSHTLTLSSSGGSLQLVEGDFINMATSGTGLNGISTLSVDTTGFYALYGGGGTDTWAIIQTDGATQNVAAPTLDFDNTIFSLVESPDNDFDITVREEWYEDEFSETIIAGNFLTETYDDGAGTITIDWDGFIVDGPDDAETFTVGAGISTVNFSSGVGLDVDIQVGGTVVYNPDFNEFTTDADATAEGDEFIILYDASAGHEKIDINDLPYLETEVDGSTTNELLDVEKNNTSVQANNLRLDFASGFSVVTGGAGEVDIEFAFNEFGTDAVVDGDEFVIVYDPSLGDEEKIDVDDLATYIGSGSADGNGIYDGSGTVPTTTVATLTDNLTFAGTAPVVRIEDTNNSGTGLFQFEINETTQGVSQSIGTIEWYITDSGYNSGATTLMGQLYVTGLVDNDDHAQFRIELPVTPGTLTPVVSTISSPDWRNGIGGSFLKNYGGSQILVSTTGSSITLDAGYYAVRCTSAVTITLPEIAAAINYATAGVIVGTQYYIINRSAGDVIVQGFNDTGTANDDFFNGVNATNSFTVPAGTSYIFTAIGITSNEGDWDVTD